MTSRQMYEAVLIELRKENAPNILLEDFNYFVNKSISQYINKRYNIYDINQQTTDDLRVLKATALLTPRKVNDYEGLSLANGATYEILLPSDYLHMLNCICIYDVKRTYKCYNNGDTWRAAATRLTADAYSQVLDNFWNKPTYKRPYYYIHNVNQFSDSITTPGNPTNPYNDEDFTKWGATDVQALNIISSYGVGTGALKREVPIEAFNDGTILLEDGKLYLSHNDEQPCLTYVNGLNYETYSDLDSSALYNTVSGNTYKISDNTWIKVEGSDIDRSGNNIISTTDENMFSSIDLRTIEGKRIKTSNIERGGQIRYGNASQVRCEIRYGTDDSIFQLRKVYIDYIKAPQNIRLTQSQLDHTEDHSQLLEFPDYVCQEIINELVHIIMENITDQRLQTHPVVSQSIANPAQQQTEPVAQQQPT